MKLGFFLSMVYVNYIEGAITIIFFFFFHLSLFIIKLYFWWAC